VADWVEDRQKSHAASTPVADVHRWMNPIEAIVPSGGVLAEINSLQKGPLFVFSSILLYASFQVISI
jgi:hypothetical protein